ncbi:hypothetical protein AVEN_56206-1 [Araneus ventricosus]|uniref:Uncharacterized protein n=1 Tax=Araneus ventricosus TaxID=182803 RepID=A0A4Y2P3A3_ARAVE|nr:hypothetical protein AVEN_56206-1 [Araneus ventricosus]
MMTWAKRLRLGFLENAIPSSVYNLPNYITETDLNTAFKEQAGIVSELKSRSKFPGRDKSTTNLVLETPAFEFQTLKRLKTINISRSSFYMREYHQYGHEKWLLLILVL